MNNYQIREARETKGSLKQRIPILAAVVLTIIAAGSYTTLAGLLTQNFVEHLGWSVSATSLGVSINMVLYGATAPFSLYLMGRYGVRKISTISLLILALGGVLCLLPNVLIFNVSWGILVGVGCGSLTMAYGGLVARKWFNDAQGIVSGILTASAVLGQFALLPFWAKMVEYFGWQAPLLGCSILALLAAITNFNVLSHHRLGSHESNFSSEISKPFSSIFATLLSVMGERIFWALAVPFLICGATTNGILWSHFILACGDAGINATVASTSLLMVGLFNVVGSVFSGWLCDRISPRVILVFVFTARALTLFWLPLILIHGFGPRLVIFGIVFGILDVATVPPVITLCNGIFGEEGASVFGWVNAFHQVGAGGMALVGGLMRASSGSYTSVWVLAGGLCVLAAFLVFISSYHVNPKFSSRTELGRLSISPQDQR